jgi:hypothetical protein
MTNQRDQLIKEMLKALKAALPYVPTDGDEERNVREAIEDVIRKAEQN